MKLTTLPFVQQILSTFHQANFEIYIVGGAVHDILTNKPVADWDFATNATPEQILELFPDGFYDNKFGTVGIIDPKDKEKSAKTNNVPNHPNLPKIPAKIYEVTTFRKEIGYTDRRHPDKIEWGTKLEEDLQRRDFTINSLALKPKLETRNSPVHRIIGEGGKLETQFDLIDHYNGQQDLKDGLIRAVGDPLDRFNEDALRMMRAVRIAAQLGFVIESETLKAIQKSAALINHIAKERIHDELLKLLATDYPADGIRILAGTGLMEYIIPELLEAQGVDQSGHHTEDVWEHSIKSLQYCPSPDPIVRLATLIHDIGKSFTRAYTCQQCQYRFKLGEKPKTSQKLQSNDQKHILTCPKCGFVNNYYASVTFYNHEMAGARIADRIAKRLRLSNKQRLKLVKLVRWHMFSVDERQTNKAFRRFIKNVGKEYLQDMLALRTGDRLGGGARETSWRLERFKRKLREVQKQPFTLHDLDISGREVMKIFNLSQSPEVGKIMRRLYDEIADKKLANKHDVLLERVKEYK